MRIDAQRAAIAQGPPGNRRSTPMADQAPDLSPAYAASGMAQQARQLQETLTRHGIAAKLIGGLAIALRCPGMGEHGLSREYHDIDACARSKDAKKMDAAMAELGLEPHKHFNAMNYGRQMMYSNPVTGLHVDVFLDVLRMCQELTLSGRLAVDDHPALPVADLVLSKLQIVELTEKDKTDLLALLLDHELTPDADTGLNVTRVSDICRMNWGWWQSSRVTLEACRIQAGATLEPATRDLAARRIDALLAAIDAAPKSVKWKARAKVGTRAKWYELPEETQANSSG
jgi:hypothetical protein